MLSISSKDLASRLSVSRLCLNEEVVSVQGSAVCWEKQKACKVYQLSSVPFRSHTDGLQQSFRTLGRVQCSVAASGGDTTEAIDIGLIEKQKTDAWIKYGDVAPPPKPVERRAKWVRPGLKVAPQKSGPWTNAKSVDHIRKRVREKAIAEIQRAAGASEVEEILNKQGSIGLRVVLFVELIRLKDIEHSKQVLDVLLTQGVDKMVVSYNKLLALLLEAGRVQDAEQLVQEMKSKGVEPNEATYNILITVLVNEGLLKQASYHAKAIGPILEKVVEAEGTAYRDFGCRSLIVAYARRNLVTEGLALLQKYRDVGLKVNAWPYNRLLESCSEKKSLRQMERVLEYMKAAGAKLDIASYSILLCAYVKKGMMSEAEGVLKMTLESGMQPDTRFYTVLMAAYAERGLTKKAEEVLKTMEKDGCPLDTVVFNTLVDAYAKDGNIDSGEKLLDTMRAAGIQPDVVTFTTLISAWAKQGQLDRAESVLERMLTAGIEPNAFTYTTLISGYAKLLMFKEANEVLLRMREAGLQPTTVTYNALITAYASAGIFGRAEQLIQEMKANGCPPSTITYSVLLSEYYEHGKGAAAARLKEKLKGTDLYESMMLRSRQRNNRRH